VDLKDKWRNLERQGIVGPNDLPAQPVPQLQNQGQVLPWPLAQSLSSCTAGWNPGIACACMGVKAVICRSFTGCCSVTSCLELVLCSF